MIFFVSIKQPDILEDFDADLQIDFQYQLNRQVPEDKYFQPPPHYIQPLSSYAKQTSCLDARFLTATKPDQKFIWAKMKIFVWQLDEFDIAFCQTKFFIWFQPKKIVLAQIEFFVWQV